MSTWTTDMLTLSTWLFRLLILFLKLDAFTSLTEYGTSSYIFGAKDKRLSLP